MTKIKAFIVLIIISMSLATVVIAGNNTTADVNVTGTASSTATPVVTQTVTQPTQTTIQPVQTAVQPAKTEEAKVKKFRVGPTVRIRPLNDEIKKDQEGLVEIYLDNSNLNDVPLTVEARISVPSGIHVYGQGFGMAGAAGMVYGTFEVQPGGVRTINIVIKAEKTGDFDAQFTGTYYPDDNKDAYQPISLTHPFKVLEASADPMSEGTGVKSTGDKTGNAETKTAKSPGVSFFVAMLIVSILAYSIRRR
jgi:hypothetical protein